MGLNGKISAFLILLIFALSLLAPYIVSYDPESIDLDSLKTTAINETSSWY